MPRKVIIGPKDLAKMATFRKNSTKGLLVLYRYIVHTIYMAGYTQTAHKYD